MTFECHVIEYFNGWLDTRLIICFTLTLDNGISCEIIMKDYNLASSLPKWTEFVDHVEADTKNMIVFDKHSVDDYGGEARIETSSGQTSFFLYRNAGHNSEQITFTIPNRICLPELQKLLTQIKGMMEHA